MPRVSVVSEEDAIKMVEQFMDHFKEKPYPPYTSNVWKDMSKSLGGRWTAHNVYINVRNNRRSIVSKACANKGIPFNDIPTDKTLNDTTLQTTTDITTSNIEVTDEPYDSEAESAGLDTFAVQLTNEQWKMVQEDPIEYGDRKYPILRRGVWTDVLALAIFQQTRLPCAFVFKHSKVYVTPGIQHYVRIKGHCKSRSCDNVIFCYINKDPGDAACDITVKTRDTVYEKHEDIKRPLRGLKRQQVGQAVFYQGCGNWQKQEVLKDTKFGERVPMNIPNLEVLRQAKVEYIDKKFDVQPLDGKDVVNTIERIKNMAPYHGFIHEVKRDKFYVSFGSLAQLHAYKQYCKAAQTNSTLSVDGTGSIVKPIIRYDGSQSGHIFLYSIVINFNHTTLSVYDLLIESQETDVFWWWLNHWLKLGAPRPKYAVCDSSRALLNGMSLSFNYQTIKTYIETCFLYAIKNQEYYHRPPINTYIRLDVAHFMAMIRRWRCIKEMRHTVVRQFYLYCVALLCDSQTLEQFQEIFSLTCTVAVHAFLDSEIKTIPNGTVYDAKKKLESYIATRNYVSDHENSVPEGDEICYEEDDKDKEGTNRSRITEWVDKIKSTSEVTLSQGTEPNPFYLEEFIQRFLPLVYEFPLWTGVAIPRGTHRGTSTHSEGNFNDLENRILRNYPRPLRADKFLKLHFEDSTGSATILSSKLRNHDEISCPPPTSLLTEPPDDEGKDIQNNNDPNNNDPNGNHESQSTQAAVRHSTPKHVGKYFRPQPDIQHHNNRVTNIKTLWLLRNGNCLQYSALINGKHYFARNTCAWDSIVQILSAAAMDDPKYLASIETSSNETLEFVRKFIETGPSAKLYRERIRVAKLTFETIIRANYDENRLLTSYTIDLWDSAANIWKGCFLSHPSAREVCECPTCGTSVFPIVIIFVNHIIITEKGFLSLQDAMELTSHTQKRRCRNENCSEMYLVKREYNEQIDIELDIRANISSPRGVSSKLNEFPPLLDLGGQQYRLAGIVAQIPGHFIAYCRRANNFWDLCNDTSNKVVRASANTQMEPHGVIYTKLSYTNTESLPNIIPSSHQPSEAVNFPVRAPFNDSDTTSQDNWRNKGDTEKIYHDSGDDYNNNSENLLKISQADSEIPTMLIDGEAYEIMECHSITY